MHTIEYLTAQYPHSGTVLWIGVRSAKREKVEVLKSVTAITDSGLSGDHYQARSGSKRQVTLIQAEHLQAMAAILRRDTIDPAELRRNLVIAGLNLLSLKDRQFRVGEAVLEMTGLCHPCSRMEQALGHGGYNTMRGHGGINARIVQGGTISLGDKLEVLL